MTDERRDKPHNIIVEGRERISVSGVLDVLDFNEQNINLSTTGGMLSITGEGLHIERLSLESGEVSAQGTVSGLNYSDNVPSGGFFSRLFG